MHNAFSHIGLIGKQDDRRVAENLRTLYGFFQARGARVTVDAGCAPSLGEVGAIASCSRQEIGAQCDLAVIVGGDGTLLSTARAFADRRLPMVGVNLGRLGFLADVSPHNMLEKMGEILAGSYLFEERALLRVGVERDGAEVWSATAFNEAVLHKWNMARMIELETYIEDRFVNTQRSDGLIIATPTGSTAYALSCGGPIVHPTLNALLLVPISPHTLSHRPVVISGDSAIRVVVSDFNDGQIHLTCDGQVDTALLKGDRVHIHRHAQPIRLVHPLDYDYYEILREKLRWSEKL